MLCEMCGSRESAFKAVIEGTEMNVCRNCSGFGRIVAEAKRSIVKKPKRLNPETVEVTVRMIVPNYSQLIRNEREKLGLSQKEFAIRIKEKDSLIHNIETKKFEPSIKLAEKIERFLKIKLIEEYKEKKEGLQKVKSGEFTIGDFIKVKE